MNIRTAERNTPQLWDRFWKSTPRATDASRELEEWEKSVRWQRIATFISQTFGDFRGLKAIEVGCGKGALSALMAKRGADVTLLDSSERALTTAEKYYTANGLRARFVLSDALTPPPEFSGSFDICSSVGLSEHFLGDARLRINRVHFDLVRPGGLVINAVPNSACPPYRIYKLLAETIGVWRVGEEFPYSRREFQGICRELGVTEYTFIGESFYRSLRLLNPLRVFARFRTGAAATGKPIRLERGTPLDSYVSYSLVLCAKKP